MLRKEESQVNVGTRDLGWVDDGTVAHENPDMTPQRRPIWNFAEEDYGAIREPQGDEVLRVQIINDIVKFTALRSEWEELECNSSASIFQTFDWEYLWWKHFASETYHHLLIILIRNDSEVVGIAPFFVQSYSLFGFRTFRKLKLIGAGLGYSGSPVLSMDTVGPTDYLDILIRKGYEHQVAASLSVFLRDHSHLWDEIELQNVPETGAMFNHVLPLLKDMGIPIKKEISDVCPRIILPGSVDEYLASLNRKLRRKFRLSEKTFLKRSDCSVEEIERGKSTEGGMQVLSSLHQMRWNQIGYPGLFSDKRFAQFQRDIAKALSEKDRLWLRTLRQDGKPVASRLGFKFHGCIYDYLSGFNHEYEGPHDSSPGRALMLDLISDSIQSGCEILDFMRGDEDYKFTLTSTISHNWDILVGSPGTDRIKMPVLFKAYTKRDYLMSRITCEVSIFKIIAGQRTIVSAVLPYLNHVRRRLFRGSPKSTTRGLAGLKALFTGQPHVYKKEAEANVASTEETKQI